MNVCPRNLIIRKNSPEGDFFAYPEDHPELSAPISSELVRALIGTTDFIEATVCCTDAELELPL